jgi:hypothetical protein
VGLSRLERSETTGKAVFRCLDDVGVRIFGRWAERDEMEKFDRKGETLDFWLGIKEEVVQMEWKGYVPNGKA